MTNELEKEIDRILKKQSKNTLLALKDGITEKYNDRPYNYNHRQRTEFYNDVIKLIDMVIDAMTE